MTRPSHKPSTFSIHTKSGPNITPARAYRMSIRAIRNFMENASLDRREDVTLINEKTGNSWTVDQAGRWS